ncbi:MAG: hypothetical protein GXO42_01165 [bacterium]|nr:hypothetical protein [bacterium]
MAANSYYKHIIFFFAFFFLLPAAYATHYKNFTYTLSYNQVTRIAGTFYPWIAKGNWIVLVGHKQSLWIGKKQGKNYIILPQGTQGVLWNGVVNPAYFGRKQPTPFLASIQLGLSLSPPYSVYAESVTAQNYWDKSAVEIFHTGVDTGLFLISLGISMGGLRGFSDVEWNIFKRLSGIRRVALKDALRGLLSRLRRFFFEDLPEKISTLAKNVNKAALKQLAKKLLARGLFLASMKLADYFAGMGLEQLVHIGTENGFKDSYFAYISDNHPAVLMAMETYKSNNWETVISSPWEQFFSQWFIHIPGLTTKLKAFFRTAGPRYTLVYDLGAEQPATLVMKYSHRKIVFWGKNIGLISRTTLTAFRGDTPYVQALQEIAQEINSKYNFSVYPTVLLNNFYNSPVRLPNSYFDEINNKGLMKLLQENINYGENPAKILYYAHLTKQDYFSHSPGFWGRVERGLFAALGIGGGAAVVYVGVMLALAATGIGAIFVVAGLLAIGIAGMIAGGAEAASAMQSWEINNIVLVPASAGVLQATLGGKIKARTFYICARIYSALSSIGGQANITKIDEVCSKFANHVDQFLLTVVKKLNNPFLRPLLRMFKLNLTKIEEGLQRSTLPLTLDWYYYYPATAVYLPRVSYGQIEYVCLDNYSCFTGKNNKVKK